MIDLEGVAVDEWNWSGGALSKPLEDVTEDPIHFERTTAIGETPTLDQPGD